MKRAFSILCWSLIAITASALIAVIIFGVALVSGLWPGKEQASDLPELMTLVSPSACVAGVQPAGRFPRYSGTRLIFSPGAWQTKPAGQLLPFLPNQQCPGAAEFVRTSSAAADPDQVQEAGANILAPTLLGTGLSFRFKPFRRIYTPARVHATHATAYATLPDASLHRVKPGFGGSAKSFVSAPSASIT